MHIAHTFLPFATALVAALSITTAQEEKSTEAGKVVVERGDDRIEVRFGAGNARPTVTINGKIVGEGQWRAEDGEQRASSGDYRLRVTPPAGGWGVRWATFPADFSRNLTQQDWSRYVANTNPEPYIGVQVGSLPEALAEHLQLDAHRCVLVISTVEDGPAARAGLQAHDVLTAIDGVEGVTDAALSAAVNGKKPGDTLKVSILRRGKASEIAIEVGKQTQANWWRRTWNQNLTDTDGSSRFAPLLYYYTKQGEDHADLYKTIGPLLYSRAAAANRKAADHVAADGNAPTDTEGDGDDALLQQIRELRATCERLEQRIERRSAPRKVTTPKSETTGTEPKKPGGDDR